jgi:hypothetical protein
MPQGLYMILSCRTQNGKTIFSVIMGAACAVMPPIRRLRTGGSLVCGIPDDDPAFTCMRSSRQTMPNSAEDLMPFVAENDIFCSYLSPSAWDLRR